MARVRLGTFRTLYERAMGDRGASSWWTNPFLRPACDRQSILGAIRNAARGVHRIARGKAERGSWIVSWDSVPATSFYVKTTGRLVDASTAVISHFKKTEHDLEQGRQGGCDDVGANFAAQWKDIVVVVDPDRCGARCGSSPYDESRGACQRRDMLIRGTERENGRSTLTHSITLLGAVALLAPSPASGQMETTDRYFIDTSHSSVQFSVSHLGLTRVHGAFRRWAGTIGFDSVDITQSSVTVVIDATSLDTGHERRDSDVRADWLEVEEFPEIIFQSTAVDEGPEGPIVTGQLEIHGVRREVTLVSTLLGFHEPLGGISRVAFRGRITFPRADFGVVNPGHPFEAMGFMGPDVEIILEVIAGRVAKPQPWSAADTVKGLAPRLFQRTKENGSEPALAAFRAEHDRAHDEGALRPLAVAQLGFQLLGAGLDDEAVRFHEVNVELHPEDYEALFWLADVYLRLGRTDGAVETLEAMLALDPPRITDPVPYFTEAVEMLRRLRGKTNQATIPRHAGGH